MKINNVTPVMTSSAAQAPKMDKVAFSGNIANTYKDIVRLERAGNMNRKLFTVNAFAFLLGGRLLKSRDKDEIRETATRDIPTILIAVFGVPVLEEYFAKMIHHNENKGFAICVPNKAKTTGFEAASYTQLNDWYRYDEKLHSGFKGFAQRLDEQGGNLKKIFSSVNKDMGKDLAELSNDNKLFIDQLFDSGNVENKKLVDKLKVLFAEGDNKALNKAKWLKTVPTLVGFAITLGLIGIMIPKLNIAITENINKKPKTKPQPGDTVTLTKVDSANAPAKSAKFLK